MFDLERLSIQHRTVMAYHDRMLDMAWNQNISEELRDLRISALGKALAILLDHIRRGYPDKLIDAIRIKRFDFIMQATTASEMQEINTYTPARYDIYSEQFRTSRFHIDEEELLSYARFFPYLYTITQIERRMRELFIRVYGVSPEVFLGEEGEP